jgi:Ca2+-binding RTX toxin-like protein
MSNLLDDNLLALDALSDEADAESLDDAPADEEQVLTDAVDEQDDDDIDDDGNDDDEVDGGDEDDALDGGLGDDDLDGGDGDDDLDGGDGSDWVKGGLGADLVHGGGGDDDMDGGEGDDDLDGGDGDDHLDGGVGGDLMAGGAGNDTYVIDDDLDEVSELADEGTDSVESDVDCVLVANVENLVLSGTAAIDGIGNSQGNRAEGNSGKNVIEGRGGKDDLDGNDGNDDLSGGDGNDDVEGDAGNDDLSGGGGSDKLKGGSGADDLSGGKGDDTMSGGGGNDELSGGGGNDDFLFNHSVGSDTITDFLSGSDDLVFSQGLYAFGDGDKVIEGYERSSKPGDFSANAELVIVTTNIAGDITASSAAAVIGRASGSYDIGDTVLFAVDNGISTGLFAFHAADANATIGASELTLLGTLDLCASTVLADYGLIG